MRTVRVSLRAGLLVTVLMLVLLAILSCAALLAVRHVLEARR